MTVKPVITQISGAIEAANSKVAAGILAEGGPLRKDSVPQNSDRAYADRKKGCHRECRIDRCAHFSIFFVPEKHRNQNIAHIADRHVQDGERNYTGGKEGVHACTCAEEVGQNQLVKEGGEKVDAGEKCNNSYLS